MTLKIPRAPKETPRATILDLVENGLGQYSEFIGTTLMAHLMVERLLEDCIRHSCHQTGAVVSNIEGFANKVRLCRSLTFLVEEQPVVILSPHLADALLEFNALRNDLAHLYRYQPDMIRIQAIAKELEEAGVEFTDPGASSVAEAESLGYDAQTLLLETTKQLFFEVGFLLLEAGGPDLIASPDPPSALP